jgi:hypothetical protein
MDKVRVSPTGMAPNNQITIYQSPDGRVNIEVLYANENIWLTQKKMAELFDTTPQNITLHLKNIYKEGELEQAATCKDFLQVQQEGNRSVSRSLTFYSLEAIIAVGYRVNSESGTQFRQWAITILIAITGQTAAEIVSQRAKSSQPNMGLTSWRRGSKGKIMPSDVVIAKNYLEKSELKHLNRIVSFYLDYAELQAIRQKPMHMKDWTEKLNAFLKFSEYEILTNFGSVSHEVAEALAMKEYEVFRKEQDKTFESDFDREVKKLLKARKSRIQ